ncbi:exported hypothetical protein [Bradyrhizobium sp. STM 3843]|nr:exported hypothetical protein [Bradyrhizobium sp. STM 3843]
MAKRTARFAFAIVAGMTGSTVLTLLACATPVIAAEDCLSEPTGDKADGQHWRYRFDRAKNQRCWYLKDTATSGTSVAKQPQQPSAWDFAQPTPPKAGPRRPETATPRTSAATLADAPVRSRADDDFGTMQKAPSLAIVPTSDNAGPATDAGQQPGSAAAPWPQAAAQPRPFDAAAPDPDPAAAALSADDTALDPDTNASLPQSDAGAAAPKPSKPVALPMLILVVVGALSMSGLMASGLYRLGRIGRRRRRNANWQMAVARARRSRSKPRPKVKPVQADGRSNRANKKVGKPAAAKPAAARTAAKAPAGLDRVAAKSIDNATGLADLLETRAVTSATMPAGHATTGRGHHPSEPDRVFVDTAAAVEHIQEVSAGGSAPPAFDPAPARNPPAPAAFNSVSANLPDSVEELENLLGSRLAKPVQPPAYEAAPAAGPVNIPPTVLDHAAEIETLLESASASPMRQAMAAPPANVDSAANGNFPGTVASTDPAAELIDLLESRFAPPADRPVQAARRPAANRARSDERPPWQRIPATPSNDDAAMPPLDFIPRPQVLRPRSRDVKHDESLDGIQDILARLARKG